MMVKCVMKLLYSSGISQKSWTSIFLKSCEASFTVPNAAKLVRVRISLKRTCPQWLQANTQDSTTHMPTNNWYMLLASQYF